MVRACQTACGNQPIRYTDGQVEGVWEGGRECTGLL